MTAERPVGDRRGGHRGSVRGSSWIGPRVVVDRRGGHIGSPSGPSWIGAAGILAGLAGHRGSAWGACWTDCPVIVDARAGHRERGVRSSWICVRVIVDQASGHRVRRSQIASSRKSLSRLHIIARKTASSRRSSWRNPIHRRAGPRDRRIGSRRRRPSHSAPAHRIGGASGSSEHADVLDDTRGARDQHGGGPD